jgi:hypothetical protein
MWSAPESPAGGPCSSPSGPSSVWPMMRPVWPMMRPALIPVRCPPRKSRTWERRHPACGEPIQSNSAKTMKRRQDAGAPRNACHKKGWQIDAKFHLPIFILLLCQPRWQGEILKNKLQTYEYLLPVFAAVLRCELSLGNRLTSKKGER